MSQICLYKNCKNKRVIKDPNQPNSVINNYCNLIKYEKSNE